MAEHQDVSGYHPPTGTGTDPADTIQAQHIQRLEKDIWTAFWGPGVALPNINSGNEQKRGEGWNQTSTGSPSMGVVSGNPASYNDATGVTASDPTNSGGGNQDFQPGDAHDATTSSVNRDHLNAIIRRTNEAISRTGHSVGGTLANIVRRDEVTNWGARRGSNLPNPPGDPNEDPDYEVGLNQDQSRVRADHLNFVSDEIEHIRANAGPPARWNYANYSDATVGAWTWVQKKEASLTVSWGSDAWAESATTPHWWSDSGGDDYKNNLPFSEIEFYWNDWNHMRYWFNQGGKIGIIPYHESGTHGFGTWHAIASGRHLIGITKPSEDDGDKSGTNVSLLDSGTLHNLGYGGTGGLRVTETVNRIWNIPQQPHYCGLGTSGYYHFGNCPTGTHTDETACNADSSSRGHISGTNWRSTETPMVTSDSSFNTTYSEHDIFSMEEQDYQGGHLLWEAEIESVDAKVVELKRKFRRQNGIEVSGDLNNFDWAMSKWYRAMALKGDAALYGGSRSEGDPEGYIFIDWRIVHNLWLTRHSVFVRCSYDNSMSAMAMPNADIKMAYGLRKPTNLTIFQAQPEPSWEYSHATDEDASDQRKRISM